MRKLIISDTTYTWVNHCAGLILSNFSRSFDVMIVNKDNTRPILAEPRLCFDSVYAQRRHDLNRLGKKLSVGKIMNLGYTTLDSNKLAAQITFHVSLSGIKEIYHINTPEITAICKAQKNVEAFMFGGKKKELKKVVTLDEPACIRKMELATIMIGASTKKELDLTECIEKFY